MDEKEIRILGLLILDRIKEAGLTQKVFTKYGNIIKMRIGTHELSDAVCSRNGLIILELTGNTKDFDNLEADLKKIGGIQLERMRFFL